MSPGGIGGLTASKLLVRLPFIPQLNDLLIIVFIVHHLGRNSNRYHIRCVPFRYPSLRRQEDNH